MAVFELSYQLAQRLGDCSYKPNRKLFNLLGRQTSYIGVLIYSNYGNDFCTYIEYE